MTTCDLCGASLDAMILKRIDGQNVLEKRCPNGHTRTLTGYNIRMHPSALR